MTTNVPFGDLCAARRTALRSELDSAVARRPQRAVDSSSVERARAVRGGIRGSIAARRHAVGVASGTDAITIALQAVGSRAGRRGDHRRQHAAFRLSSGSERGRHTGTRRRRTGDGTIDPSQIEAGDHSSYRAILPVHLYGQCADLPRSRSRETSTDSKLVEDCAQAHGRRYEGRSAGTVGDAAAFSFYPTKNLGALGDGGAVVIANRASPHGHDFCVTTASVSASSTYFMGETPGLTRFKPLSSRPSFHI